eukprot:4758471-Prorocentrum_lima.AAC.1
MDSPLADHLDLGWTALFSVPQHQEYIDDFALQISAPNALWLSDALVPACESVLRSYNLLGLPVNVAPGTVDVSCWGRCFHLQGQSRAGGQ